MMYGLLPRTLHGEIHGAVESICKTVCFGATKQQNRCCNTRKDISNLKRIVATISGDRRDRTRAGDDKVIVYPNPI